MRSAKCQRQIQLKGETNDGTGCSCLDKTLLKRGTQASGSWGVCAPVSQNSRWKPQRHKWGRDGVPRTMLLAASTSLHRHDPAPVPGSWAPAFLTTTTAVTTKTGRIGSPCADKAVLAEGGERGRGLGSNQFPMRWSTQQQHAERCTTCMPGLRCAVPANTYCAANQLSRQGHDSGKAGGCGGGVGGVGADARVGGGVTGEAPSVGRAFMWRRLPFLSMAHAVTSSGRSHQAQSLS